MWILSQQAQHHITSRYAPKMLSGERDTPLLWLTKEADACLQRWVANYLTAW